MKKKKKTTFATKPKAKSPQKKQNKVAKTNKKGAKKEELSSFARELHVKLSEHFVCEYDETQSIGKRYRREDEIGTPYCVTVDFETKEDGKVTVRDRDTMRQERVAIAELVGYLKENLAH